jgi:hypothetical protein
MRKAFTKTMLVIAFGATLLMGTSCATVFGGRVTDYQRTKPAPGEPARKVRAVALICDILLFWPGVGVDFLTHAIYKPSGN